MGWQKIMLQLSDFQATPPHDGMPVAGFLDLPDFPKKLGNVVNRSIGTANDNTGHAILLTES